MRVSYFNPSNNSISPSQRILRNRVLHQYTVAERDVKVGSIPAGMPALSDIVLGFQIEEDPAAGNTGGLKTFEAADLTVKPTGPGTAFL